jgi:preprotein translocase SecE subunit
VLHYLTLFSLMKFFQFFRNARSELSQVTWPTKAEMRKYFSTNLIFIGIAGTVIITSHGAASSGFMAIKNTYFPSRPRPQPVERFSDLLRQRDAERALLASGTTGATVTFGTGGTGSVASPIVITNTNTGVVNTGSTATGATAAPASGGISVITNINTGIVTNTNTGVVNTGGITTGATADPASGGTTTEATLPTSRVLPPSASGSSGDTRPSEGSTTIPNPTNTPSTPPA